jgi:hypothetical protein
MGVAAKADAYRFPAFNNGHPIRCGMLFLFLAFFFPAPFFVAID